DSHWRESILANELMTGWAGPGVNLPLSRITVASLADLGYVVNMNAADSFTPTASSRSAALAASGSSSTGARITSGTTSTADAGSESGGCSSHTTNSSEVRNHTVIDMRGVDALMAAFAAAYEHDLHRLRA